MFYFNLKIENHRSTPYHILSKVYSIHQQHEIKISFESTPEHASVHGNELPDRLKIKPHGKLIKYQMKHSYSTGHKKAAIAYVTKMQPQ